MAFKVIRTAQASWSGTVEAGGGRLALGSGAFEGPFTLRARVEDGVPGANPEELIGAGHAGCFTMSLADLLAAEGHPAVQLSTSARVHLEQTGDRFSITLIELETTGDVPGLDAERFTALAEQAKRTCPVSRALAATEITLAATLAGDRRDPA